jgi:hypothetical protein
MVFLAKLGNDAVEVLLRAQALPFEDFHNRGDLPHVGDRGFFEGHGVAFRAVVTHGMISAGSCTSRLR